MKPKAVRQNEFTRWMGPLLDCLRTLGGSAKPREVSEWIADALKIPDSQREEILKSGQERFHNQVQWARQYLVWEGLLDSSRRGVWTLTPKGWSAQLSIEDGQKIFKKWVEIHSKQKVSDQVKIGISEVEITEDLPVESVSTDLLDVLKAISPKGFELVCKRLLHESGFEKVTVTGRSHDGGIDGIGILPINPFVAFRVVFQCKRYSKNSVSRAEVGDFRSAMIGRADKGIIITTGTFSADAIREANRDGAPPVELVDGETLVSMFEAVNLGVISKTTYEVDQAFFEQFRNAK